MTDIAEMRELYDRAKSRVFSPISNTEMGLRDLDYFFETTLNGDQDLRDRYAHTRYNIGDTFVGEKRVTPALDALADEALERYEKRYVE